MADVPIVITSLNSLNSDLEASPDLEYKDTKTTSPSLLLSAAMEFDEEATLRNLTENVRDQDDLERDISIQANLAMIEAEDKKDEKRMEKAQLLKERHEGQRRSQQQKLRTTDLPKQQKRIREEIDRLDAEIKICDDDMFAFGQRITQRHEQGETFGASAGAGGKLPNESNREYLIRTGKITPFATIGGSKPDGVEGALADAITTAEDEAIAEEIATVQGDGPRSHQVLRLPGFTEEPERASSAAESEFSLRPRKRRRVVTGWAADAVSEDEYKPEDRPGDSGRAAASGDSDSDSVSLSTVEPKRKRTEIGKVDKLDENKIDFSRIDDGNERAYQTRLRDWVERRSRARQRKQERLGQAVDRHGEEWFKPCPDQADHRFENGLKLPGDIYPSLFDYQKTGVQWLAELYAQEVGGIIGDEMGLGKTVQLISFLAALHYSERLKKPVIVVAPATVLRQWVNEFHRWWPPLRVSILHSSGSGMCNVRDEDEMEDEEELYDEEKRCKKTSKAARQVVERVVKHGHVLITTYAGLQTYGELLIPVEWGYAVLDEGHKIRNPNTTFTIYCKELRTGNRVILSGTPMQNNLTELWSLFDFIYPMRLGTLVDFRNSFEIPIKMGGYANASRLQIMTAQKCAETLKETISPYLLQRLKVDVAADLPKKSEQVLFCKLTQAQRKAYERFLRSDDMSAILNRSRQSLYGIDILRKICNHPDLLDAKLRTKTGFKWGSASKSGKMQVVKSLLPMWRRLGHKTLLFCQGTQMLDMLEEFVRRQGDMRYLRMDGKTAIKQRQTLVDQFNTDPAFHLFLLTTKVGGLGTNLTGANRVIIFDPDWNPSTDVQARERAWRLGQKREVTIYRLMTAGTIEEKMYHRQIYKQFLSNKVLRDPKQQTTFNVGDLHDLFTLSSYEAGRTETGEMFKGSEVRHFKPSGTREFIVPGNDQGPIKMEPGTVELRGQAQGMGQDGDIRQIEGVAGLEVCDDQPTAPPNEEDRLMEGIFARSVHSALEHDEIMGGKKKTQADRQMLEQEAKRVAAQAALRLRRAGEQARSIPPGTVTWTGQFGEGGRPTNMGRGRGGSSTCNVLAGVANRQGLATGSGSSANGSPSRTPVGGGRAERTVTARDFEKMVVTFIKSHGGQAPSKLLLDHFQRYCPNKTQADRFMNALEKVAKMGEKGGSNMRVTWKLRPGFE